MINIVTLSSVSFELNSESSSAVLPKAYDTRLTRSGSITLYHVITGAVIVLGDLSDISINGNPATLEEIRQTVFNMSCTCSDNGETPKFKIFDYTFDNTFE
jgi:hypothetical protein